MLVRAEREGLDAGDLGGERPVWAGLALSYTVPVLPPSFAILAVATLVYVAVLAATRRPPSTAVA